MPNENTSKDKLNKADNQQLFTRQIVSTNVQMIDTESDKDTELAEEWVAVNHRQELTGDPLSSFVQFENLGSKSINVCLGKITFPNIFYQTMTFKPYPFQTFSHMVVVATIVQIEK